WREIHFTRLILEALEVCDDLIVARRQRGGGGMAGAVADGGALDAGRGVTHRDRRTRNDRGLGGGDGALGRSRRLGRAGNDSDEGDEGREQVGDDTPHHSSPCKRANGPRIMEVLVGDYNVM